jgi:hypothetical protein
LLQFSYDFNNVCIFGMTLIRINILPFLFYSEHSRLYRSSAFVAPWIWLQFVAEVLCVSITTNPAIGWKQTNVYKKISRNVYKIKLNASVCSVEVCSALKMDTVTSCENRTVYVTQPGVLSQQMIAPGSCGAVMCCNCSKKLHLVMF